MQKIDYKEQKKNMETAGSKEQILAKVLSELDLEEYEKDSTYKFTLVDNMMKLSQMVSDFAESNPQIIAVDTETQGLGWGHKIIGVSLSWSEDHNYYLPFRHVTEDNQLNVFECREYLQKLLSFEDKEYVFHNYKFDRHMLKKDGIEVSGIIQDTMLMHYVIDENEKHSLKSLACKYVDPEAHKYEKFISDFRKKLSRVLKIKLKDFGYEHIPINIMVQYACRDTLYTLVLHEKLREIVHADKDRLEIYRREIELLPILCDMEEEGVFIDQDLLGQKSVKLGEELECLNNEILSETGMDFDLNSPKQLREMLQKKGIHTRRYTPTGKMSTDNKSLKSISRKFPFVQKVLNYREKFKNKNTYTDPLRDFCDENSRIHCNYMQAVAVTGRLTCTKPSLQVIPRSTGIRDAFLRPSEDYFIVAIDLDQLELRVTCHFSEDPILMHAYTHGEDIHSRTAAEIFDIDISDVKKEQRTIAKPINFGIIYGIGPNKLAETLGVDTKKASHYIERYLERYAGVAKFIEKYKKIAKTNGYVKNYFGRVRHLNHLLDPNIEVWRKERAYRQAVNYIVQSSAADMFKIILIRCHEILMGKKTKMVMNIHDELVFYWHKDEIDLIPTVKRAFEDWDFKIPIIAEVSYSMNSWGDKEPLGI